MSKTTISIDTSTREVEVSVRVDGERQPHIKHNHVDGPCIMTTDHRLVWLNLWERFLLFWGFTNGLELNAKILKDKKRRI